MKPKSNINFIELPTVKERNKFIYIIAFICGFIILYSGILKEISFLNNKSEVFIVEFNYVVISMAICIMYILLKETINRDIKYFFKDFKKYFKHAIKSTGVLFIITTAINFAITILLDRIPANEEDILSRSNLFFVYIVILGPIAEELLFRGLLRKIIDNDIAFIIISSILFGSIHILGLRIDLIEWIFLISYSVPGFILASNYKKTNNLVTVMLMHIFYNLIGVLISIIPK